MYVLTSFWKSLILVAIINAVLLSCTSSSMQDQTKSVTVTGALEPTDVESDSAFLSLLLTANANKRAEQDAVRTRSTNPDVLEVSEAIKAAHEALRKHIVAEAARQHMNLTPPNNPLKVSTYLYMASLSGREFDTDYTDHQVSGHTRLTQLMEGYRAKAQSETTMKFITDNLPTVKHLLQLSLDLQTKLSHT